MPKSAHPSRLGGVSPASAHRSATNGARMPAGTEAHGTSGSPPGAEPRPKGRPGIISAVYLVSAVLATMAIYSWAPSSSSQALLFPSLAAISFAAGFALREAWALLLPLALASVYLLVAIALIEDGSSSEWDELSRMIALVYACVVAFCSEVGLIAGLVAARVLERVRGRQQTR